MNGNQYSGRTGCTYVRTYGQQWYYMPPPPFLNGGDIKSTSLYNYEILGYIPGISNGLENFCGPDDFKGDI